MVLVRSSSTPLLIEASTNHPENRRKIHCHTPQPPLSGNLPATMRRTRSDGNFQSTAKNHPKPQPAESNPPCFDSSRAYRNRDKPMAKLEPIPSFSFPGQNGKESANSEDEFSFPVMLSDDEKSDENREIRQMGLFGSFNGREGGFLVPESWDFRRNPAALFMTNGLGSDRVPVVMGECGPSRSEILKREKIYEKLIAEDPCNALLLRNYAKFLCEIRRNYNKAEEMYSRAILSEPGDGETVSEFAMLNWKINGDYEAASRYFDISLKLAPTNNHVVAAYASFLWETEGEGDQTS